MLKTEAIEMLGGTPTAVAEAIGITPQAVSGWPDVLSARVADRVYAAVARKKAVAAEGTPEVPSQQEAVNE
jgi:hypothetical protein